jgi:hypothetical protein
VKIGKAEYQGSPVKSRAATVVGMTTTITGIQRSRLIRPSGRLIAAAHARAEASSDRSPLIQRLIGRIRGMVRQRLRTTASAVVPSATAPIGRYSSASAS